MADARPNRPGGGGNQTKPDSKLDQEMVRWTRAVAIFTFFLVATSAVSDWFIFQQWSVANKSQTDTREQLRAVVAYQGGLIVPVAGKDGKIDAYVFLANFQNFGATRTGSFRAWASLKYFDGSVPNNLDLSKPFTAVETPNIVIGPNSPFQIPVSISFDDVQKALDRKGVLLLWGHAEYSDIFDPTNTKPIQFCIVANPSQNQTGQIVFQGAPYRTDCNTSK